MPTHLFRSAPLWQRLWTALFVATVVVACTVNPVTGQRQLALISTADEIQIGEQYYAPSLQMQGGEYRLDPELTAYVERIGQRLAAVSDRDLPYEFAVINSSVPNAWALPGGKIAINRGLLLEMQSESELAAVLGHEIVHAAARHGAQAQQRAILAQAVIIGGAIAAGGGDFGNLAAGGLAVAAQLVSQRYGRGAELEADRYGMVYMHRAGYHPDGAVALQETFVRMSEEQRTDWLSGLFASHPPSEDRVRANQATAEELGRDGELGFESYQAAVATIREQQPAYDAIDEGRAALMARELEQARSHAEEAIALLPEEAHGYALRGDIARLQERPRDALPDYSRAIELDPEFFYFSLQRGLVRLELDDWRAGAEDLRRSVDLLPTVPAYYGLGRVSEREGDIPAAKEYYARAADPNSEQGQAAYRALLRLDLPDNPEEYLQLRYGPDEQGRALIEIHNPQAVAIGGVVIEVRYRDSVGIVRDTRLQLRRTVEPGSTVREVLAELGRLGERPEFQARLISAQVAQ